MRRIETGVSYEHGAGFPTRWISERDYRLLLAVARAAEQLDKNSGEPTYEALLGIALDKLNAKGKGKR